MGIFRDCVPLIHYYNDALELIENHPGDVFILCCNAFRGVNHKEHNDSAIDSLQRSNYRVLFYARFNTSAPTDTCCIDERDRGIVVHQMCIDRISRCTRDRGNDDTFFTKKFVQKTGFAHIRSSHDGYLDIPIILFGARNAFPYRLDEQVE